MKTSLLRNPALITEPEFEALKGERRNLNPRAAVEEVRFLQEQSRRFWSGRMTASPVDVADVVKTLTKKRIPFVLTGAHGISVWTGRPRNTYDVDILVKAGRNYTRAVNAMRVLYPKLDIKQTNFMARFFMEGDTQSVLDVVTPLRPDNEQTLANPVWIDDQDRGVRYRIPSLEEALANKYGAILAAGRKVGKRLIDAGDFANMVEHSQDEGRDPIDMARLHFLGELVWPGGGGDELARIVEQIKAGQTFDLSSLG